MQRSALQRLHAFSWTFFTLAVTGAWAAEQSMVALPENIAPEATVTASSEYDARYLAKNVVDGRIPPAGSRADGGAAWCVRGRTAGDQGELRLTWNEPVDVAELIFFGRTAYGMREGCSRSIRRQIR